VTSLEIWAYSESEKVANEVATAANELANANGGRATVIEFEHPREGVSSPGRKLVLKASAQAGDSPEIVAEAIFRAATRAGVSPPSLVLVGATRQGRETAARLAVKLKTGCVSEAVGLSISEGELKGTRNIYAGKFLATVGCTLPCVATTKTGVFPPLGGVGQGDLEEVQVGGIAPRVRVVAKEPKPEATVDLKAAKVIVSAGRGVKKKEDLTMIEDLARAMGGVLGCSRPLSSDLGWLPEEHHIGLTGLSVRPDLYVAVGISGQLQHLAGVKDSKVIVAINTDKEAPIFQAADYGIVGDLYQLVPAIRNLLPR
jgi:electron transfer flavoprotein alpha subunit